MFCTMRWAIEIESIEGEERLLTETLAAIDIDLNRNDYGLFLRGKPFERLDHQKDVRPGEGYMHEAERGLEVEGQSRFFDRAWIGRMGLR